MIAVQDHIAAQFRLDAVAGRGGRAGQAQGLEDIAARDVAEGDDDLEPGQGGEACGQEGAAGRFLDGQGLVAGRGAADGIGDMQSTSFSVSSGRASYRPVAKPVFNRVS